MKFTTPLSLKNEIMRSKAEASIANFLFMNGVEYKYEEPYPEKIENDKAYLPDFTIDINGVPLYIEYFGLSSYYENDTISETNRKKYEDIRFRKRAFHKLNKNNYIELDYKKTIDGNGVNYLEDLELELKKRNVKMHKLSDKEIYDQILNNNVSAEFYRFVDFVLDLIHNIKENPNREKYMDVVVKYISSLNELPETKLEMFEEAKLFFKIYNYYESKLFPQNRIDFADMIYHANRYLKELDESTNLLDYEYLIIDEYQDISLSRYHFAKNISAISNAKVISVGDDWQTIFSFAGSRIDLFLKYNSLFPGAKQLFINSTYRNSQELINKAGEFVMQNPLQIRKNLVSNVKRTKPIKFCYYENDQYEKVAAILRKIYQENSKDKVLILARKNRHIKKMLETNLFNDGVDTRVVFLEHPDMIIDAMSIHSAKGLGADQVILLNITNDDFPCKENEKIWFYNLFKPHGYNENYPFAEDRRIFYVALTRTKKDVYLLIPENKNKQSSFINELLNRRE